MKDTTVSAPSTAAKVCSIISLVLGIALILAALVGCFGIPLWKFAAAENEYHETFNSVRDENAIDITDTEVTIEGKGGMDGKHVVTFTLDNQSYTKEIDDNLYNRTDMGDTLVWTTYYTTPSIFEYLTSSHVAGGILLIMFGGYFVGRFIEWVHSLHKPTHIVMKLNKTKAK